MSSLSSSTTPTPPTIVPTSAALAVPPPNPNLSKEQNIVLNLFEDYFSAGAVTSKVGSALQDMAEKYHFASDDDEDDEDDGEEEQKKETSTSFTDKAGAIENYGQFLQFGEVIDALVTEFVENVDLKKVFGEEKMDIDTDNNEKKKKNEKDDEIEENEEEEKESPRDTLLTMIAEICNELVDDPSAAMYVSIPYVAAGLDFERFENMILDTKDMMGHQMVTEGESS